ncbi:hypothetical protein ACN38_g11118 [Penicillium nordicum]|uniref:Zn(2)-C6 fungal-type domain-containing protein n=1 Tax=Penicillium nordicum TaxID=229535 RepID=A0A0M9WB31_9EURO|nr:hypothetical protein ACN38_g11118 [Penicillium nordicum]
MSTLDIPRLSSAPGVSPRIPRACERCRSRKVRCDGNVPCATCRPGHHPCIYRTEPQTRKRRTRVKDATASSTHLSSYNPPPRPAAPTLQDPVQFKRQRELRAGIGISNVDSGSFQFYGPSSHFCFIERTCQRITQTTNETLLTPRTSAEGGLGKWNLERFMFSLNANRPPTGQPDAYLSQEKGSTLIDAFFEIIHPQVPVLNYADIVELWEDMGRPPAQQRVKKGKEILFMVLAIGARVSIAQGPQDTSVLKDWADYFAAKANGLHATFEDVSLHSTIFLLLKGTYAIQVMRPNEAYLYLGHAARSVMALGINRQQVVNGANLVAHSLKRTFWAIYSTERICSLYTGRPSAFRDDLNDAPYPEDLPLPAMPDATAENFREPLRLCGFVRAMAGISEVADLLFLEIYSPKSIPSMSSPAQVGDLAAEAELLLESVTRQLPLYLHFFDTTLPLGRGWQEVQRLTLGCQYYFIRMLMHRHALIFAAFFDSREEAQRSVGDRFNIDHSIQETTKAASNIIDLIHEVYFRRYPRARFDGSSATILVSACITLLYDVLDPKTNADHAKFMFAAVERGVECLDQIHHVGHTTGKAVSLDVMNIAKDALHSTTVDPELSQNLFGDFPWLQYVSPPDGTFANSPADALTSDISHNIIPSLASHGQGDASHNPVPGVSYMSHRLETGFEPQNIPSFLF